MRFFGIHHSERPMYIILYNALKIIHLKLLLHTPKANGQIHAQNNNVTKDHQCASKRAR